MKIFLWIVFAAVDIGLLIWAFSHGIMAGLLWLFIGQPICFWVVSLLIAIVATALGANNDS
jgi:hypothetical protein